MKRTVLGVSPRKEKKREQLCPHLSSLPTPVHGQMCQIMPSSSYCLYYKYSVDFLFREKVGWFSNFKRNAGKMQNIWKVLKSMELNKMLGIPHRKSHG